MSIVLRQSNDEDLPKVKELIQRHWRFDHPFLSNQVLLDFQHKDLNGKYCFSLAEDVASGLAIGMCGWISYRKYDIQLSSSNSIWYTNWFVAPGTKGAVGLKVQEAITQYDPSECIGAIGLLPQTLGLYKSRRFETGSLATRTISVTVDKAKGTYLPRLTIDELNGIELQHDFFPAKSAALLSNKYLSNPFRRYVVFDISIDKTNKGVAVFRDVLEGGNKYLQLIDFCGSAKTLAALPETLKRFPTNDLVVKFRLTVNKSSMPDSWTPSDATSSIESADERLESELHIDEKPQILYAIRRQSSKSLLICVGDGDYDRGPGIAE